MVIELISRSHVWRSNRKNEEEKERKRGRDRERDRNKDRLTETKRDSEQQNERKTDRQSEGEREIAINGCYGYFGVFTASYFTAYLYWNPRTLKRLTAL